MDASDVISIYTLLDQNNVAIWIDGGWGVDALLEKQTRTHPDLDIAIQKKDLPKFREILTHKGFKEIKQDIAKSHNFVLGDELGREIDVHVIEIDSKGNGIYGPKEKGEMYPATSLTGKGKINNLEVRCISPEWLIKFHSGYSLKEKDFYDVSLLTEKFGIPLPEEYKKFSK